MTPSALAAGPTVLISVARTMLVNVPVAWLGGRLFGEQGVFLGVCAANLLVGTGAAWWIWRATAPEGRLLARQLQDTRRDQE